MLREIPAGHKVSLVISRDGNMQTIAVELADRKKMEHDVWNRLDNRRRSIDTGCRAWEFLARGGDVPSRPAFTCPSSAAA